MFPFIAPGDLTNQAIGDLERLIRRTKAFPFSLIRALEFEQGVVYLEPAPAEPFVRLTKEISRQFAMLPFRGEFGDQSVAHLTVATAEKTSERRQLIEQLSGLVPISLKADEAWLMVGSNAQRWNLVRQMRFGE